MRPITEFDVCDFKIVQRWLNRLGSDKSRKVNRNALRRFLEFLKKSGHPLSELNPDELVDFQLDSFGDRRKMFEILDAAQEGVDSLDGLRYKTSIRLYSCVRSFFIHNRAELPRDVTWRPKASKPKVRGKLSLEDLVSVIRASNEPYAALFSCMAWGMMGWETFDYWNRTGYEGLVQQLKEGNRFIQIISNKSTLFKQRRIRSLCKRLGFSTL